MIKYKRVTDYIESLPDKTKNKLIELREILIEVLPNCKEVMGYGVPAFELIPNAKMEDKIMIAGFKNHVGLYPHPDTIVHFKKQLSSYKTLKGTIQFNLKDDLPRALIQEIAMYRYKQSNKNIK